MHIQLCKVRKKNGAEKKIWAEKKNGPKRPTNLAETTQLQNWAETTQAETTRPKRLRTETTQGPKRFRAETSRDPTNTKATKWPNYYCTKKKEK